MTLKLIGLKPFMERVVYHVHQMHDTCNAAEDGNASYDRCMIMHVNAPDTE